MSPDTLSSFPGEEKPPLLEPEQLGAWSVDSQHVSSRGLSQTPPRTLSQDLLAWDGPGICLHSPGERTRAEI